MATLGSVHVGDVGTLYKAKIQDRGTPFNPTSAIEKKLIFKVPGGVTITRDASVTTDGTDWYLEYTVLPADVVAGLHAEPGSYFWQGYVKFDANNIWHTTSDSYVVTRNLN